MNLNVNLDNVAETIAGGLTPTRIPYAYSEYELRDSWLIHDEAGNKIKIVDTKTITSENGNTSINFGSGVDLTLTAGGSYIDIHSDFIDISYAASTGQLIIDVDRSQLYHGTEVLINSDTILIDSTPVSANQIIRIGYANADNIELGRSGGNVKIVGTSSKATISANSLTTDRTISIPDGNGFFVLRDDTATLSSKTINLTNNTVSGTAAQFNTACSDKDFCFTDNAALTDARYSKYIDYDNTTSSHTGNTTETILKGDLEITGNTMGVNSRLMIDAQIGAAGTAGTKTFRLYIAPTANSLVGATLIGTNQLNTSALSGGFRRIIVNKNSVSTNEVYPAGQSATVDLTLSNSAYTSVNYDFTNTAYIIITVQNSNAGDTGSVRNIQLTESRP
jgi:hypothetical protein